MFNGSELTAEIRKDSYPLPSIFEDMINKGVDRNHMYNTFNMGLGMIVAVAKEDVNTVMEAIKAAGETPYVVGHCENGEKGVRLC
jgi:phosphoribosylformylglycinamidine cyclo-ligase